MTALPPLPPKPEYKLDKWNRYPRLRRLAREHYALHALCERSKKISYRIGKQLGTKPPEGYFIFYNIRSIVGIQEDQMPIYGDFHEIYFEFPESYPSKDSKFTIKMVSDIWHPNIRCHGAFKGRMCVNEKSMPSIYPFDSVVVMMGEMLQFKNYLADETPPYPEDETVAKWVREFAEPKGIVDLKKGIFTDYENLLEPEPGFEKKREPLTEEPKNTITVRVKNSNDVDKKLESPGEEEPKPLRIRVVR